MSLREENNYEKARREKLGQRLEDDYDVYLFWPSLSNRNLSPGDPPSSPLYGPVSLDSDSTDYDSVLSSGPPSPIMFAQFDYQSPPAVEMAVDFGATSPKVPDTGAQVQSNSPAKYSAIVKIGLFFSQVTRRFDRAIEGVKLKLRKPKKSEP